MTVLKKNLERNRGLYESDIKAMKAVMALEELISVWIQAVANEFSLQWVP